MTTTDKPRSRGLDRAPATRWTMIRFGEGDAAVRARIAGIYYEPVAAFIRSIVRNDDEALELANEFFEKRVLEHGARLFAHADRSRGQFRRLLERAVRNFLKDQWRSDGRRRRVLADPGTDGVDVFAGRDDEIDAAIDRARIRELVVETLEAVEAICSRSGQAAHYELFVAHYLGDDSPGWEALGERFGVDGRTACHMAETPARQFRAAVRERISAEVADPELVESEIAALLACCEAVGKRRRKPPASVVLDSVDVGKLRALLLLAGGPEERDPDLPQGRTPSLGLAELGRLLDVLGAPAKRSGAAYIASVCTPGEPPDALLEVKNAAKAMLGRAATAKERDAATLLYHAAIAAAIAWHGVNPSTRPARSRIRLYEELATAFDGGPLGKTFREAAARASRVKHLAAARKASPPAPRRS